LFKDIGNLLYDSLVNSEIITVDTEVFLNKKSVSGTEFYKAVQSGVTPSITFETRTSDFELTRHIEADTSKPLYATRVKYDGAVYDIIRTYDKPNVDDITVIVCS
jgi:hypothetical protein